MSQTETRKSAVFLGDTNLIGKSEGDLVGAAMWATRLMDHRGQMTIKLYFENLGDSREMVIGLDGKDL